MFVSAVALAVIACALAWPVPIALARATWPSRAPGTALALWQSIAIAGGLSMIGSLLCYALIPLGNTLPGGLLALARGFNGMPEGIGFDHVLAFTGALLLACHLLLNLSATFVRSERQRRRHHQLVQLLSDPVPDRPDTRVIEYAAPVAYCLPGAARSVTVLSAGIVSLLNDDELQAVIAHERAHLRQQHPFVLLMFKSWRSALPWFPIANRSENAVALLVEMLADDEARHEVDDLVLARAIALAGTAGRPEFAFQGDQLHAGQRHEGQLHTGQLHTVQRHTAPDSGDDPDHVDLVTPRVMRLVRPQPALPVGSRAAVLALAVSLLAVPTLILLLS